MNGRTSHLTPQIPHDGTRLRLSTTVRLRWVAVAGQIITILAVFYGLGFALPLGACLGIILCSAVLNLALTAYFPRSQRLVRRHAMILLSYDILQLSALLFLTGGLENPFALLLVVPVAVSASSQPLYHTAGIAALAVTCTSALAFFHLPLPWNGQPAPSLPLTYILGSWAALISCIVFMAIYTWRIGQETRQMSQALTAAELVLAREQKLTALDGLAAAAAHQLGTPLSTIAVVARELERQIPANSPLQEDVTLLRAQALRCREILKELSITSGQGEPDRIFSELRLSHLLEEVIAPFRSPDIAIAVDLKADSVKGQAAAEPVIVRNPGLIHALSNLVENAVEFASTEVNVSAWWSDEFVTLTISDDGPGIDPYIITQLGEPYVTKKPKIESQDGLGLGFFIAKTFIERSGASLKIANSLPPASGACIELRWPRWRLEEDRAFESAAL